MKKLLTFLFLSVLLISLTACGGSSTDSGDTTNDTAEETTTNSSGTQKFGVGQEVTIGDVSLKLNEAFTNPLAPTTTGNLDAPQGMLYLLTSWSILNNGDSDLPISTENFTAYLNNSMLETSNVTFLLAQYPFTGLDTLAPGRQYDGCIVYEIPENWTNVEIEFKPNMFIDNVATFELTPETAPNLAGQTE